MKTGSFLNASCVCIVLVAMAIFINAESDVAEVGVAKSPVYSFQFTPPQGVPSQLGLVVRTIGTQMSSVTVTGNACQAECQLELLSCKGQVLLNKAKSAPNTIADNLKWSQRLKDCDGARDGCSTGCSRFRM